MDIHCELNASRAKKGPKAPLELPWRSIIRLPCAFNPTNNCLNRRSFKTQARIEALVREAG